MMKRVIGSFGLYCVGLAPSITPPCDGALLPLVAAAAAAVVVAATEERNDVVVAADIVATAAKLKEEKKPPQRKSRGSWCCCKLQIRVAEASELSVRVSEMGKRERSR
jgi:hypothetical protein